MKNSGILAFIGGAVAGAAVALLLAPKSGEQTRRMIKDFVDQEVDRVKQKCAHNHHNHAPQSEPTDINE